LRVQDQEEDQRGPGEVVREDCRACKMNKVDAIDRCKWRKMIEDVDLEIDRVERIDST